MWVRGDHLGGAGFSLPTGRRPEPRSKRQFKGSSFTIDAPWLLPTQNVTGVVELSTNTRRTFVNRGRRYSTNSPVLGLRRCTVSVNSPPDQASPFLSAVTSYGHDPGVGAV